jgi:hypothetical protein
MKIITAQYGKLILAAIMGAAVFGMCMAFLLTDDGSQSLRAIATEMADDIQNYEMQKNRAAFRQFTDVKKPTIRFCYEKGGFCALHTGERIKIADCIYAADSRGNELHGQILTVTDQNGNSCEDAWEEETQTLFFTFPGVYTVTVSAKDSLGKECVASIEIPVEEVRRYA